MKTYSATAKCQFPKNTDRDQAWDLLAKAFLEGVKNNIRDKKSAPIKFVNTDGFARINKDESVPITAGDVFKYNIVTTGQAGFLKITDWNPGKSFAFNEIMESASTSTQDKNPDIQAISRTEVIFNEGIENNYAIIRLAEKRDPSLFENLKGKFNGVVVGRLAYSITLGGSNVGHDKDHASFGPTTCFDHVNITADKENKLEF
ncbi:MAG: hypothetical protein COB36_07815 [Alphaproteobacteria bacterium]|nr:MAG: hypothetical protein COB36_07815 [Alphaproteobacteria bacterium]